MSTYTQILYQIVFGSKDYTNFLTKVNQDILYNYPEFNTLRGLFLVFCNVAPIDLISTCLPFCFSKM